MIHVGDSRSVATRHEKRHSQTSLPTESLEEAKTLEATSHSYLTPAQKAESFKRQYLQPYQFQHLASTPGKKQPHTLREQYQMVKNMP